MGGSQRIPDHRRERGRTPFGFHRQVHAPRHQHAADGEGRPQAIWPMRANSHVNAAGSPCREMPALL
jgi:hypothetical protein